MPYIDVKISTKLDDNQKQQLVSDLGKIITIFPNKTESSLMVGVDDDYCIFKAGGKREKAAYLQVKIFGDSEREVKNKVTEAISKMMLDRFGIESDAVYITFHDIHSWGAKGKLI